MHETNADTKTERGIVVGLVLSNMDAQDAQDTLDELALLADTAGVEIIHQITQERNHTDATYLIGSGKAQELAEAVEELDAKVVIFDDDLSPAQTRNLETLVGVKIVDRSRLILDIFASRAQTREAQTQVELAQLIYMLPRLTRQWTHLSRQAGTGGGGVGTRGPGETQLEVDRRATRYRIEILRKALKRIAKQRAVARKQRTNIFQAALVGYTNAGKSTLMRALSGADVFIEDRLFATLDSTTRKISLGYNRDILISDTVGFIKKLPHHLVASFRSTLEEAIEANKGFGDEHGISFVHLGTANQFLVDADKDRLMQVLSNLMSNAAKFSPPGGRVELAAVRDNGIIRIAVKDNGPGIPEEFRDTIFDKFSQADSSDTRQKGGTGLGLSISKAIIEKHNGAITFETETGVGSTFTVELPVLVQSDLAPAENLRG